MTELIRVSVDKTRVYLYI